MDTPVPRPDDDPRMHRVPFAARTQRRKVLFDPWSEAAMEWLAENKDLAVG